MSSLIKTQCSLYANEVWVALFIFCLSKGERDLSCWIAGSAASSLGSAVSCRVEGRVIDTALGQCFIPNSSH